MDCCTPSNIHTSCVVTGNVFLGRTRHFLEDGWRDRIQYGSHTFGTNANALGMMNDSIDSNE
jgi:hypothetical protein